MKRTKELLSCLALFLLCIAPVSATTIYIAGDSTAANYSSKSYPQYGWGQALDQFVKPGIKVENMAVGGRSTKSFIDENRWDKLIAKVQPGDFVLVQFGHNDQKSNNPKVYANVTEDYPKNLNRFIADVKSKQANIVIISSITRRFFDRKSPQKLIKTLKDYPKTAGEVAKANNVPFIDMYTSTRNCVEKLGPTKSIKLFNHLPEGNENFKKGHTDNSHLNVYGAKVFSELFVNEVKSKNLKLAKCFK